MSAGLHLAMFLVLCTCHQQYPPAFIDAHQTYVSCDLMCNRAPTLSERTSAASSKSQSQLQSSRHWFLPPQHRMISLFRPQPLPQQAAAFSCSLTTPALAYLWQHSIRSRPILPGAAIFEVAFAAAAMLAAGDEAGCKGRLVLSGSSITSPFLLQKAAGNSAGRAAADKLPALACTVQQGMVGLSSAHGSVVHLQGQLSALPQHAQQSSAVSTASSKADAATGTIMQGMASIHDSTSETSSSSEAAVGSIDIQVRASTQACLQGHHSVMLTYRPA